mmetsp:Transcript_33872/g.79009  ORF Transcript_33872/g.79009 Transcript_33872/m.79009 type:complete len:220 (-) Transcript_33872:141-800(-)
MARRNSASTDTKALSRVISEVLFFIDWPCVDQTNPMPENIALPAYVSACSGILAYDTAEYRERAWCRVELLMAYAFCATGDVVFTLESGFVDAERGIRKMKREDMVLLDPTDGRLTNEGERDIITQLKACAEGSSAFSCWRVFVNNMTTSCLFFVGMGCCCCCMWCWGGCCSLRICSSTSACRITCTMHARPCCVLRTLLLRELSAVSAPCLVEYSTLP